jgi:hypothetical protein
VIDVSTAAKPVVAFARSSHTSHSSSGLSVAGAISRILKAVVSVCTESSMSVVPLR